MGKNTLKNRKRSRKTMKIKKVSDSVQKDKRDIDKISINRRKNNSADGIKRERALYNYLAPELKNLLNDYDKIIENVEDKKI